MNKPTLVIMAAGIGSRYGGLKQIDPVGLDRELIIDYSIYDALRAGFGKVVFVIKKSIEADFREIIGDRIEERCDVSYIFQEIDRLPDGFKPPNGRVKPWGTGHALLLGKDIVKKPFAVINADDFYGATSFQAIYDQLKTQTNSHEVDTHCMVGYSLVNTLPQDGHVARGICTVSPDGYLCDVHERTKIQRFGDRAKYSEDGGDTWVDIPLDSIASMNLWGFTPSIFPVLETAFRTFLKQPNNDLSTEFFLPTVVNQLLESKRARVKVIPTKERWVGVTYRADKPVVEQHILHLIHSGVYPEKLWK